MTGTLAVAHGGTGVTTGVDAANYFLNQLSTGSSTPVDADYYISQYVGGGNTTTTYHRRPMSALWAYIKGKIGTVGSASEPVYFSSGVATKGSKYAGGTEVTLNGTSKAASTASFYAPTGAGTSGYVLQSAGSGAPTWINATNSNTASTIVKRDASGNFSAGTITAALSGNASTATKTGVAAIWLYPEKNNEINFGGTNTSTTIYFGYRAKDSRPIPTKFVFGNTTGTADLQAKTVYLGSGTTSYISSTQYTGNAATATTATSATSATSAGKLSAADKGSTTNPIYFSNGIPAACTYELKATLNNATQWGVGYYSTTTNVTSTDAGTAGQYLIAGGTAAPSWTSSLIGSAAMTLTAGKFPNLTANRSYLYANGLAITNSGTANDQGWVRVVGSSENDTVLEIATGDDGNQADAATTREEIAVRQYGSGNDIRREIKLFDKSGNTIFNNNVFIQKTSTTANTASYGELTLGNAAAVSTTTAHSEGRIRLYSANTGSHYIQGTSTTSNYTHYLPNSTGWIVTAGNGTSTGAGSSSQPVYISTAGVATAVDSVSDAYINWGGPSKTGTFTPLDAGIEPIFGANRFAGVAASAVESLYSTDGGSTWVAYGDSDSNKRAFFTNYGGSYVLGKNSTKGATDGGNFQLKIILTANNIYTYISKLYIYISTNGGQGCKVSIEGLKNGASTYTSIKEATSINGWSGYNVINNLSFCMSSNSSHTSYYQKVAFIFTQTGISGNYTGLNVLGIKGIGGVGWTTPSTLAKYGQTYTYDADCNSSFAGNVSPSANNSKNLGSSSYRWAKLYIGTADTYGGATNPIYWNGGVPAACTYNLKASLNNATQWGVAYYSTTTNVTSTTAGTAGYLLQSNATSAPTWIQATNANTASTIVKRDASGNFSAGTITAALSGNASTATKLATARAINGTNFDGSAAITTTKWGTARNITVKDSDETNSATAVSVDGSANITLKLPATIKASITGNVSGSSGSCTGNAATATSATKATQDGDGNVIKDTYIKKSVGTTAGDLLYFSAANTPARLAKGSNGQVLMVNSSGNLSWGTVSTSDTKVTNTLNTTSKFYITGTTSATTNTGTQIFDTGVYVDTTAGKLVATTVYGAVWNDYAEYREVPQEVEAGRCVKENGKGQLIQTMARLEPAANIVSDTFGFAIGETDKAKTAIAVCGRVLAYPYESKVTYAPGDAVCSGPNGTISKMSREEIINYPDRIVGTVSEIPTYETWGTGNVPVKNRIWIKIK